MNRDQKAAVIEEIAADITAAAAIFAIDYRGITVAQAEELRARLRGADASFRVVKNSLTERAADQAGADQLKPLLEGPTALTFARGDAAAAAKAIADFARVTQLLPFKGGVMDGAALTPAEVGAISRLPSRDVLYGQLVGLVASPIAGLARTLQALIGGLAVGLGGVLEKKEAGELPADAPAAAAQDAPVEGAAAAPADEAVVAEAAVEDPAAVEAEAQAGAQDAPGQPVELEAPAGAAPEAQDVVEDAAAVEAELESDDESAPAASGDDEEKE